MVPLRDRLTAEFEEHAAVLADTRKACLEPLERLIEAAIECLSGGGKLMFFGNGGSAADAQHWASEFTIQFVKQRAALAAIALTTDTSAITACANDLGFERIFARQIEAIGRPGDIAIAITTSGNSPNVLAAIRQAKEQRIFTALFTGETGGRARDLADLLIAVPSRTTARIQEMHEILGHQFCREVEATMNQPPQTPAI
jgi:D-sedoheptulose 7-phosphate isomerase